MSVANYVCQSGYELIGAQQRTCQHTGNWSEEPPMCLRKRDDIWNDHIHTNIVPCKNTFPAKNIMISNFFVFHFHHYCYTEPLPPVNVTVEQVNNSHVNLTWEYSMGIVRPCEVLITPLLTGLESGVS